MTNNPKTRRRFNRETIKRRKLYLHRFEIENYPSVCKAKGIPDTPELYARVNLKFETWIETPGNRVFGFVSEKDMRLFRAYLKV